MPRKQRPELRIGIYAGAFDPVHAGHVAFALQALESAKLDQIIFLPERRPRQKPSVEHFAHRTAMLKKALAPHPDLAVMEMVDKHLSVQRTLPQLRGLFPKDQLVFLMGADTVATLPKWHRAERLLDTSELVVGMRAGHNSQSLLRMLESWESQPQNVTIVDSFAPDVSSSEIRQAIRENQHAKGLLASVSGYARREWLYVSPGITTVN